VVLGDLVKRLVRRHKEGHVVLRAVQRRHDVRVLVHDLGEPGRILGLVDELVDGEVGCWLVVWVMLALAWSVPPRKGVIKSKVGKRVNQRLNSMVEGIGRAGTSLLGR
jgi:hypothetical protein